ncbi:MAG: LysM peptidoglycan-binding domain-containing protein [Candidatus Firestonebacteria bacterium]|nr:LysM peptidoglycan-binding domain-containing protein [Candidatus Firestonebacteria bacterium]
MNVNSLVKVSVSAILVSGLMGLAGCGAKQEVKPVETPVATAVPTPAPAAPERYSVSKHDTLWGISGKQDVYGDNFQWPLIFKANRDQIQDPDIIEIGQDLAISREFKQEDVAQAIENAKKTPRYHKHKKPRKHLPIEY